MTALLLAILAQAPIDLSSAGMPLPVRGRAPVVAFDGTDYVVAWLDDRFDALQARDPTRPSRGEVWWARPAFDGGLVTPRLGCQAREADALQVVADPTTGAATLAWLEASPLGGQQLRAALVDRPGRVTCLPAWLASADARDELRAVWTGNATFLAWASNTVDLESAWLVGPTLTLGPVVFSGLPADAQLTVARANEGARLAWRTGVATVQTVDVAEGALTPTAGSGQLLAGGTHLALDPDGDFLVRTLPGTVAATWFDGGTVMLASEPLTSRLALTSGRAAGRSLLASEGATRVLLQSFGRDGGLLSSQVTGEGWPALASDGAEALLVTTRNVSGELRWRRVPFGSPLTPTAPLPVAVASPAQRRPSLAWVGDGWLLVFDEWTGQQFASRSLWLSPDGQQRDGAPLPPGLQNAALVARPDGRLLVRADQGATSTSTFPATRSAGSGVLTVSTTPDFVSPDAPWGAATNEAGVHWKQNTVFTPGMPTGVSLVGAGMQAFRSSAASPAGVWLPVATGPNSLNVLFLDNAALASTSATPPMPAPPRLVQADREVAPAMAALAQGAQTTLLMAWRETTGVLKLSRFRPDGTLIAESGLPQAMMLQGLAAAAVGDGFLVAFSSPAGVAVVPVPAGADPPGLPTTFATTGELAGDPVLAGSPQGHAALVWPVLSPAKGSVTLKLVLFPAPATTDGGVPLRDGGVDGGGNTGSDAGPSGGGDAGTVSDGGVGGELLVFDTSGCGCTTSSGAGTLWGLALAWSLAARRRRTT